MLTFLDLSRELNSQQQKKKENKQTGMKGLERAFGNLKILRKLISHPIKIWRVIDITS